MPLSHNMDNTARYTLATLTGIVMPTADPRALRATAELYETTGTQITHHLTDLLTHIRRRVRTDFSGQAADYFDRSVAQFTTGDNDYIGAAGQIAADMGRELRKAAANAEYMAMMVIGQLVQLLLEIAWAIASAYWTFGASLKMIPVFKAIRSLLIRRILSWFLLTVPGHQIISQIFASLDSIIQRIQIANGTRTEWDHDLTTSAHLGAVIEGLLSAGLSAGVEGLLSSQIRTLIRTNLDTIETLPDPPPITTPRTNPRPTPGPGTATGPGPGLNEDLADVLARHTDEMATPYTPNDVPGMTGWANNTSRDQLRHDLADLFQRHFGPTLGTTHARSLGHNYADTLAKHWTNPDLPTHLHKALGDTLPPALRDHLATTIPNTLTTNLRQFHTKASTQAQNLTLGAATGATEGYLGEGLTNALFGQGWKASGFSASAGATQATAQTTITTTALTGIDHLRNGPDLPPPPTTPPPTTNTPATDQVGPPAETGSAGGNDDGGGNGRSGNHSSGRDSDEHPEDAGGRGMSGSEGSDHVNGVGRGSGVEGGSGSRPQSEGGSPEIDEDRPTPSTGNDSESAPTPDGTARTGEATPGDNPYVSSFTEELVSATHAASDDAPGQDRDIPTGAGGELSPGPDVDWPLGDLYDTPEPTHDTTPAHPWQPPLTPFDLLHPKHPILHGPGSLDPKTDLPLPTSSLPWPTHDLQVFALPEIRTPGIPLLPLSGSHGNADQVIGGPAPVPGSGPVSQGSTSQGTPGTGQDRADGRTDSGRGRQPSDRPPVPEDPQGTAAPTGAERPRPPEATPPPPTQTPGQDADPPDSGKAPPRAESSRTAIPAPDPTPRTDTGDPDGAGPSRDRPGTTPSSDPSVRESPGTPAQENATPPPPEAPPEAAPEPPQAPPLPPVAPPPPDTYQGTLLPDRSTAPYDLGYLLDSHLTPADMVLAEHLRSFVDGTAADPSNGLDTAARTDLRAQVEAQAGRDMGVFFQDGGHPFTVTGQDGRARTVEVSLRPSTGDFFHVPTSPASGSKDSKLKTTDTVGEPVSAEAGATHGGERTVNLSFLVSPLHVASVNGNSVGPRVSLRVFLGTRVRSTGQSASHTTDLPSNVELKGRPEVYVADLDMSMRIAPADGSGGGAPRTATARADNGLVLVVPGGVVPSDGPETIRVYDPFTPQDDGRSEGRDAGGDGRRPLDPRAGRGHPIKVGPITLAGDGGPRSLADWVNDHLTRADAPPRTRDAVRDRLTPSFLDRRDRRRERIRQDTSRDLAPDAVRNRLPMMTNAPVPFEFIDISGDSRVMTMWSVPTDYTRKGHTPSVEGNNKANIKGNVSDKGVKTTLRKNDVAGFAVGAGMAADIPGQSSVRVEAPFLEYSLNHQANQQESRSVSGSVNRTTHGATASAAYDVHRNYYVRFDGEPQVYRFTGDTVEILTVEDARIIDGEEPSGARTGGGTAQGPSGESSTVPAAPTGHRRPPFANLAGPHPTDFTGAVPRTFSWPDGSRFRGSDGEPRRGVYDALAHQVLSGLARRRPGLVLPDLSSSRKDYARRPRPDQEVTGYFDRSPREHRPLRRDHDIARYNTLQVLKAISESSLRGGLNDLGGREGIPVDLIEPASINLGSLFRVDEKVLRPKFVRVRLFADFERLAYVRPTVRGTGGEFGGSAGRSTDTGSQNRHTLATRVGLYARPTGADDVHGQPPVAGTPSVTVPVSRTTHTGQGQGFSHGVNDIVFFPEGSDVWHSRATLHARLYEFDDSGLVRGEAPPLRERGIPLLDAGFPARLTLETPPGRPHEGTGDTPDATPVISDIRPLPTVDARRVIRGNTTPDPVSVQRRRDPWRWARSAPRAGSGDPDTAAPGPVPVPRTTGERRAERIRNLPTTVQHSSTRFRVRSEEGRTRTTSLVDETYQGFSAVRRRFDLHDGYRRKLEHFLVRGEGNRRLFPDALSSEVLSSSPNGSRVRAEMSGGLWSPHDVRATVSTELDVTSIDRFEPSEAMIERGGTTSADLSVSTGRTWSGDVVVAGQVRVNDNPRPDQGPSPDQPLTYGDGLRPIGVIGPQGSQGLFNGSRGHKAGEKYAEATAFSSKLPMAYSFTGSGTVRQATEFLKNWSIGPTIPWSARFRGWTARVSDLVTGLVHIRDAHRAGLVDDRVVERNGELVREPQPEPRTPGGVRVRPGLEDTGKRVRPADSAPALRALADDLASQGWELTAGSREGLLHALDSNLGSATDTSVPLPVRIRPIDHSVGHLSSPTTAPPAVDATVRVRLDLTRPAVEYLGGSNEFKFRQTWRSAETHSRAKADTTSAGVLGGVRQPLPYPGDDQPDQQSPESRPHLLVPAAGASQASTRSTGSAEQESRSRRLDLSVDTPYAKLSHDSRLHLDLEISERQPLLTRALGEQPGGGERRDFSGSGDGGRVDALYPISYLDFAGGDGTDTGTGTNTGDGGTPDPPRTSSNDGRGHEAAPEHPVNGTHASLHDMMRQWSEANGGDRRAHSGDGLIVPAAIGDRGQQVRDTAHIVVARSLGWSPPPDAVRNGQYTSGAIRAARAHNAAALGFGSRYNAIDQALGHLALKALHPEAADRDTELPRMGRTTWSLRALPDPASARVLDIAPSGRITDSGVEGNSTGSTMAHGTSSTTTSDVTASGRGEQPDLPPHPRTGIHYGGAGGAGTSKSGGSVGQGVGSQLPPHSQRARIGPLLLVEFDTTWGIGARSELRGSAFSRAAGYVGDKVRGLFGRPVTRPARWQLGDATTRTTAWIAQGDAVRMGIIGQAHANGMAADRARLEDAQKVLNSAEKTYLESRLPLESAAAEYAAAPDDAGLRDRYRELERTYEERRTAFDQAMESWVASLNAARDTALGRTAADDPATAAATPAAAEPQQSFTDRFRARVNTAFPEDTVRTAPATETTGDTTASAPAARPTTGTNTRDAVQDVDRTDARMGEVRMGEVRHAAERPATEQADLRDTAAELRNRADRIRGEIPALQERIERLHAEVSAREREVARLEEHELPAARRESDSADLARVRARVGFDSARAAADSAAATADRAAEDAASLAERYQDLRARADEAGRAAARLGEETGAVSAELARAESGLDDLRGEISRLWSDIDDLTSRLAGLEAGAGQTDDTTADPGRAHGADADGRPGQAAPRGTLGDERPENTRPGASDRFPQDSAGRQSAPEVGGTPGQGDSTGQSDSTRPKDSREQSGAAEHEGSIGQEDSTERTATERSQVQAELDRLTRDLTARQAESARAGQSVEDLRDRVADLEREVEEAERARDTAHARAEEARSRSETAVRTAGTAAAHAAELDRDAGDQENRWVRATSDAAAARARVDTLTDRLTEAEDGLDTARNTLAEAGNHLTELDTTAADLEHKAARYRADADRLRDADGAASGNPGVEGLDAGRDTAWPPRPAWGEGVRPQGMRDGQVLDGPGQGAMYLPLLMPSPGMTASETSLVRGFAADNGTAVNDALRGGTGPGDTPERTRRTVDALDTMTARSATPDALILHQSAGASFAHRLHASLTDPGAMLGLVGRTYTDPGFTATATDEPAPGFGGPVTIVIRVPRGYPALNTSDLSRALPGGGPDVVLRRGTTFVVHGVRPVRDELYENDHWVVEAEVVPDGWTPPADWRGDPRGSGGEPAPTREGSAVPAPRS
ncbi:hypothetical protein [Nocardiopsis sp. YSL2]|uniref:hypothetical protein n=1 Tax=Nocardiopsis sp. YSL2 TaxID=2939492 RepID=UPI0026F434E1|nr:hypothetical protein [Nocardiopsis sp. YSL2]